MEYLIEELFKAHIILIQCIIETNIMYKKTIRNIIKWRRLCPDIVVIIDSVSRYLLKGQLVIFFEIGYFVVAALVMPLSFFLLLK
jgi:hypothetical protein